MTSATRSLQLESKQEKTISIELGDEKVGISYKIDCPSSLVSNVSNQTPVYVPLCISPDNISTVDAGEFLCSVRKRMKTEGMSVITFPQKFGIHEMIFSQELDKQ